MACVHISSFVEITQSVHEFKLVRFGLTNTHIHRQHNNKKDNFSFSGRQKTEVKRTKQKTQISETISSARIITESFLPSLLRR
jgi:hypothetical protein